MTYEIREHDPDRRVPDYTSISGYVFGAQGHVQISAYFDTQSDRDIAYRVIRSVCSVV